jgi:hypothetical protein
MQSYLGVLNAGIARGIAQWPRGREIKFYPLVKKSTLDRAATSFLGEELGDELETTKQALTVMLAASIAVIRVPLPGTRPNAAAACGAGRSSCAAPPGRTTHCCRLSTSSTT